MSHTTPIKVLGICLAFLLVVAGYLGYLAVRGDQGQGPQSQRYDFGTVRAGQVVKHPFVLRNPTSKDLEITGIVPSCACVMPKEKPTRIPARSSCEIPVLLRAYERSGGMAQRTLVSFKDRGPITLALHGNLIKATPDSLSIPKLKNGDPYETQFLLKGFPGEKLAVHRLEYDQQYFDVTYVPVPEDNSFRFNVRMKNKLEGGPFRKALTIHTNDSVGPTKSIPITGYVLKRVEAQPATVAFGIVAPRDDKTEVVKLYSPYGDQVTIDRIESSPGSRLAWKILESTGDRSSARVEIRLKAAESAGAEKVISDDLYLYARAGDAQVRSDVAVSALVR